MKFSMFDLWYIHTEKGYIDIKLFPCSITLYNNNILGTGISLSLFKFSISIVFRLEDYF